jgi:hypothetical protein
MRSRPSTTIVSTTQASTCLSFSRAFSSDAQETLPELPEQVLGRQVVLGLKTN